MRPFQRTLNGTVKTASNTRFFLNKKQRISSSVFQERPAAKPPRTRSWNYNVAQDRGQNAFLISWSAVGRFRVAAEIGKTNAVTGTAWAGCTGILGTLGCDDGMLCITLHVPPCAARLLATATLGWSGHECWRSRLMPSVTEANCCTINRWSCKTRKGKNNNNTNRRT